MDGLRHAMEGNKIKLAMRKMKLQLANSNRQIKDYLMGSSAPTMATRSTFSS